MGHELLCQVRSGGKTVSGKALLVSSEIIFRGDLRLKIPIASLRSVAAKDGELHLKWAEGSAVFELGEHAQKWMHKILHPKSVTEKLGVKPGLTISALGIRDAKFVEGLRASAKNFSEAKPLKHSDLIFFATEKQAELARLGKVVPALSAAGAVWIVYPKGKQEIKEQHVLDAGKQAGLVDVKVVGFSPTHTALKFVRRKSTRK